LHGSKTWVFDAKVKGGAEQRATVQQEIDIYNKDHLVKLRAQPERYRTLINVLSAHLSKPLDELT